MRVWSNKKFKDRFRINGLTELVGRENNQCKQSRGTHSHAQSWASSFEFIVAGGLLFARGSRSGGVIETRGEAEIVEGNLARRARPPARPLRKFFLIDAGGRENGNGNGNRHKVVRTLILGNLFPSFSLRVGNVRHSALERVERGAPGGVLFSYEKAKVLRVNNEPGGSFKSGLYVFLVKQEKW